MLTSGRIKSGWKLARSGAAALLTAALLAGSGLPASAQGGGGDNQDLNAKPQRPPRENRETRPPQPRGPEAVPQNRPTTETRGPETRGPENRRPENRGPENRGPGPENRATNRRDDDRRLDNSRRDDRRWDNNRRDDRGWDNNRWSGRDGPSRDRRHIVIDDHRRIFVPPERRRVYRNVTIVRPYGHWYHGYGRYYRDDEAWRWLGLTAITVALLNTLNESQQRAHENAQILATTAPIGQQITWADQNAQGYVVATRDGTSTAGRYCREFQQTVMIGGRTEQAYGTACQQPDGSWQVTS
jgi:hypothetical protein